MSKDAQRAPQIPIVNIVSYSYKGGSGRSTASVNIAFSLAKQGKLVVCLDMDVGAAGLHMIISDWDEKTKTHVAANRDEIGHQLFFNASNEPSINQLAPALIDIDKVTGVAHVGIGENPGRLLFAFSSTKDRALKDLNNDSDGARAFKQKYLRLQQLLAREVGGTADREVYFIVDAPNGITNVSLPLLKCADLILMFYRYSLQHVQGTVEAGDKLIFYLRDEYEKRPYMRLLLVGSCVPERIIENLRQHADSLEPYEREMLDKFNSTQANLEAFADDYPLQVELLPMHQRIGEDDLLKILEQPITNAKGVRNAVLGYPEIGWPASSSAGTMDRITAIANLLGQHGPEIAREKKRRYGG